MENVGMDNKSLHVQQFRNTLLDSMKDQDKKQHELFPYYDDLLTKTVLDKTVLDSLISRCVLMIEDRDEIIKPATQTERNKVLLDILTKRPYGTFNVLKDVLKESDPYNTDVQELVSRMQCIESCDESISCHDIIFHKHIVQLQKNYMKFVHDVDSKTDIADYLYEKSVLNTEEKEEVCSSSITRHDSNRILYSKLFRKGEDAYTHLVKALRHGQYEDIAFEMENTQVSEHEIQLFQIGMNKLQEREKERDFHAIQTKLEDLTRTHDEVIPNNILEQFERRLKRWKEDDKMYFSTAAEKPVMTKDNMDTDIEFAIRIPDNKINSFIERLVKDWDNGFVDNVFDNRNMNSSTFKKKFINKLNKLDQSKQEELACKHDIKSKDIALGGSCYVGSVDLVRWLISRKSDINYCKEDADPKLEDINIHTNTFDTKKTSTYTMPYVVWPIADAVTGTILPTSDAPTNNKVQTYERTIESTIDDFDSYGVNEKKLIIDGSVIIIDDSDSSSSEESNIYIDSSSGSTSSNSPTKDTVETIKVNIEVDNSFDL
ncbi:unnamed protein product [Mytilus edulis]|uniref:CARD domain-containing protein n=1 Tax=Mytilus edulis TaxID=6550 RepID=A0A8S3R9C8_MYTED|nr:unnamed protein product [Mytilus edulis]